MFFFLSCFYELIWWIFFICSPGVWSRADGSPSCPGLLQSLPVWDLQQWQRASRSLARHLWGLGSRGCRDLAELCLHCPVSSSAYLDLFFFFYSIFKRLIALLNTSFITCPAAQAQGRQGTGQRGLLCSQKVQDGPSQTGLFIFALLLVLLTYDINIMT